MTLLFIALALLLAASALAPFIRLHSPLPDRIALVLALTGCLCGLAGAGDCLLTAAATTTRLPWTALGGHISLRLDPLAGLFLLPAFFLTAAGLLYGSGYLPTGQHPGQSSWVRFFYPLLTVGITLLVIADNGAVFLVGWEIMALSGYFLVVTERHDSETHQAGYIYLTATHTGTLALFGMFALLGESACITVFPPPASMAGGTPLASVIFLLALFGFGLKAGIVPLHIWLPRAHAAAPSHVSALMSGVMIKTGIYGLLRLTSFYTDIPSWWGGLLLILGMISGILGVLFAIAQHNIKRLLAYHSVENIGIILIGIGAALLGRSYDMNELVTLGLAGGLLHVINHGLFKGLLFLSAGSMIHASGSRLLADYGGLLKAMPLTGLFFLGGAVAICGLPPLNGFVSEWLISLGLFRGGLGPASDLLAIGLLLAVLALALIGALALLCFAKVFGLAFLGMDRATPASGANRQEAPTSMLVAMALLLSACLWIGLLPVTMTPLLAAGTEAYLGYASPPLATLAPVGFLSLTAALLLALLLLIFLAGRFRQQTPIPRSPTWGCGYPLVLARGQYTTSSFAEAIMKLFNWTLGTAIEQRNPLRLFPGPAFFRSHTPDPVLDRLLWPAFTRFAAAAHRTRRLIQHGIIGIYLLYSAVAVCALLIFVLF
ncbi:MAG: proton-conducting transporter membrane subunit [Thermodesulfobacteriota bacterium]